MSVDYRFQVIRTPLLIRTPGDIVWRTLVIFGEKSSKITVFSGENLPKLSIVCGQKNPKKLIEPQGSNNADAVYVHMKI